MALLIDIAAVPERQCNDCLNELFKAMAESPDGDAESIWTRVPNRFVAAHVESVTIRFQGILQRIQDAIGRMCLGETLGELAKASPWVRWDETRLSEARARLQAKSPADYTIEDWMEVVDVLLAIYLPDGVINNEAEYITVKATILGKIQASVAANRGPPDVSTGWEELVPTHFAAVPERMLSKMEREILHVAKTRAALHISNVTEAARSRLKTVILEHVQAGILGQKEGRHSTLATHLFDEFSGLNRDFRRIAITEAGECVNQGFVSSQPFGAKIVRIEAYKGACDFCKSINGKTFTVVDPAAKVKNGDTEVWFGKTNVGRSAAPRQRSNGMLIERSPNERWWVAAGLQHPHCRGAWRRVLDVPPDVNPDFAAYLDRLYAKPKPPEA